MPPERDPQVEIEQLEQRVAENPEGRMFAHLADAYRKAGELDQAERIILDGLERHPDYVSAHLVLGRIYMDGARAEEAGRQFQRTLELDPHNLIALKALGDLAVQKGASEEARSWYGRMLQVDPYNDEAQAALEGLGAGPHEAEPPAWTDEVATEPTAPSEAEVAEPEMTDLPPELQEAESGFGSEDPGSEMDAGIPESPESPEELELADRPEGFFPEEPPAQPSDADLDVDLPETPDVEPEVSPADELRDSAEPMADSPDEPGPEELDIDFEEMDAWSPGLVQDEDLAGERMDDDELLGVSEGEGEGEEDDVVTETMAELYLEQGLHGEALEVYRRLGDVRPHDERIRARIRELEERLEGESGGDQEASAAIGEGWETMVETGADAGLEETEAEAGGGELEEPAGETEPELDGSATEAQREEVDAFGTEPADVDVEELFASPGGSAEDEPELPVGSEPPAAPELEAAGSEMDAGAGMGTEPEEPSMQGDPVGDEFEFEVRAPADDLEGVDPFAASFSYQGEATAPSLFQEETATPFEEEMATPSAEASPEEPALQEERPVPSEEETGPEVGELAPSAFEAADVSAPEPGRAEPGPVEREEPATAPVGPDPGGQEVPEERVPSASRPQESIRAYLQGLLHGTAGANGDANPAAGTEPGGRGAMERDRPTEHDEESGSSAERSDEPEDLAQFQEWLRSLKR